MKIKNKLTLLFTGIIALLLLALTIYIFSLSKSYASSDFFKHLKERAFITANVFLEEDEASKKVYTEFREQYLDKLPSEIIRVYNANDQQAFINDSVVSLFSKDVIDKTRKQKTYEHKNGNRYVSGIFYSDNQGEFVIIASAMDTIGDAKLNHLRNVLMIGFFISVVIVFFLGRFFTSQMLQPVSVIVKQVKRITETNLHLRLNEGNGKDEIAELAKTFNNVLTRLESAFVLQRNFVADASHELRTPLTSIIGNIDVTLSKERTGDEYRSILNTILEEAERLHKLSNGLLNIAQANVDENNLKPESIRIDELLEEAIDIVNNQVPKGKFELIFNNMPSSSDELMIFGNKNLLLIAFENLLENASKFSDHKKVEISLLNCARELVITVHDSGIGIPEKDIGKVSQTFYRAENARQYSGSGIGLALSQKIILLHNGKLFLNSSEGKGTTATVQFPKIKFS